MSPNADVDLALVCPRCRNELRQTAGIEELTCQGCQSTWSIVAGIPDFRLTPDPFLTVEEDRAAATRLTAQSTRPFPDVLAAYYEGNSLVPEFQARAIIRATLAAQDRSGGFLGSTERLIGWRVGTSHHVLDIGMGTGPLAVEVAKTGAKVWGVDIGLRWVALARARARDAHVSFNSCCAGITRLPFRDASFDVILAESLLELVPDQAEALRELHRVMRPGGHLALATPNRWSPGPDPHLGLPLTSWLPQPAITALARLRGILPPKRRLLSRSAIRRLFKLAGLREVGIVSPELPDNLAVGGPAWLRAGVAGYRFAARAPGLSQAVSLVSPILIAVGQRPVD